MAQQKKSSIFGTIAAFIILIIFIGSYCGKDSSEGNKPTKEQAATTAQDYIKECLKNPDSFDAPWTPDKIEENGDNTFTIFSHFNAKNSFGGTIRSSYIVTLKYIKGDWMLNSSWEFKKVIIDDKIIK